MRFVKINSFIACLILISACTKEYLLPSNCYVTSLTNAQVALNFIRTSDGKIKAIEREGKTGNSILQIVYQTDTIKMFSISGYNQNSEMHYFLDKTNNSFIEKLKGSITHDTFVKNYYYLENNRITKYLNFDVRGKDTFDIVDYYYNSDNTLQRTSSRNGNSTFYEYYDTLSDINSYDVISIAGAYFKFNQTQKLWKSRTIIDGFNKDTARYDYRYSRDSLNRIIKIITTNKNISDTTQVGYSFFY